LGLFFYCLKAKPRQNPDPARSGRRQAFFQTLAIKQVPRYFSILFHSVKKNKKVFKNGLTL